jgi:hypothetical protein
MVHILAPQPPRPELPLFFDLDSPVGKGAGPGEPADVLLVQALLRAMAARPPEGAAPELVALWGAVPLSGRADAATASGIAAAQAHWGLPTTGVAEVARGYRHLRMTHLIVRLNDAVRQGWWELYPNLDRLPDCPAPLAQAVRRALAGVPDGRRDAAPAGTRPDADAARSWPAAGDRGSPASPLRA